MKLTRRYRFAASHRLDVPALSAEENRRLFGKCNNPFGHGHDYTLEVTVEGEPDASGQIVNRRQLDEVVRANVLDALDHRNLNSDVAALEGVVPTTENLALAVERMLAADWRFAARLSALRIAETGRNRFELRT